MRIAMQEAQIATNQGNYPFGAVLADREGNIIARAHNTQISDVDPTAHAEINLIRAMAKQDQEDLSSCTLVSNAESCSMCMSAAIKVGILKYIFGAPSEAHMEPYLTVSDVALYCRRELDISLGVLSAECQQQIASIREEQGRLAQ